MKVHANLKELLEAYDRFMTSQILDMNANVIESRLKFLASNSLALGKPRPLAKNKQTNNKLFDCPSQENGICDCTDECTWDFDEIT